MFLKFSSNKGNSSRHKIYTGGYGTNSKKKQRFYSKVTKNKFKSNIGRVVMRGRRSIKQKRSIIEVNSFLCKNSGAMCIDFTRDKMKSTHSALVSFANGICFYIKSPHGFYIGDYFRVINTDNKTINSPYCYSNDFYKIGYLLNIVLLKKKTICFNYWDLYARSGGTYCVITKRHPWSSRCGVSLPSGKRTRTWSNQYVFVGRCSNTRNKILRTGSAGNAHKIGCKPINRGVSMNPVDHPNGGRTKTCRPLKNIWGKIAKKSK